MDRIKRERSVSEKIIFPAIMLIAFWFLAIILWKSTGHIFFLFNFGYIGSALGLGIGLYSLLPRKRKPFGRKVAQFLCKLKRKYGIGKDGDDSIDLFRPLRYERRKGNKILLLRKEYFFS